MSAATERYFREIVCMFQKTLDDETGAIAMAAELMGNVIMEDKLIHVIGTGGHSNLGAEEMFWRAGGLVPINAILDPGTMLSHGAIRSNHVERAGGYAKAVLDAYRVHPGMQAAGTSTRSSIYSSIHICPTEMRS